VYIVGHDNPFAVNNKLVAHLTDDTITEYTKQNILPDVDFLNSNRFVRILRYDFLVIGKNLRIGFDPLKLSSCLKKIGDKEVLMKFTSNVGPCILAPVEGDEYAYMVLPVRVVGE
jgi:DNA polymerase-3 subunit beta